MTNVNNDKYLCAEFILEGCKLASGVAFALCSGVNEFILDKLDSTSESNKNKK